MKKSAYLQAKKSKRNKKQDSVVEIAKVIEVIEENHSEKSNHNSEKPFMCENCIKGTCQTSKLYARYMDDVITILKIQCILAKLEQINQLHPALTFTHEREIDGDLSFLDMLCQHRGKEVNTTWFTKSTDTGLVLNYHSLAPEKYKRGVIIGMIHRIYRSCSNWKNVTQSLEKARTILKNNQYPEDYTENIISRSLSKIITAESKKETEETEKEENDLFFINYRGKITEEYAKTLKNICESKESPAFRIPIKIIMTMRKLKTLMPTLKEKVPKMLKSDVVYQITCPVCKDSYVGQTERHMVTRFKEHIQRNGPVKEHIDRCDTDLSEEDIEIKMELMNKNKLLTYEALFIKQIQPVINTKEEYKSKKLTIKWVVDSLFPVKNLASV